MSAPPLPQYQPLYPPLSQPGPSVVPVPVGFDPVQFGNIWSKRIILGVLAVLSVVGVIRFAIRPGCVETVYDNSLGCWTYTTPCIPTYTRSCTDAAALVSVAAQSVRSAVEMGRADQSGPIVKILIVAIGNLALVQWVAKAFKHAHIGDNIWAAIMWTCIAAGPEVWFASRTPMYSEKAPSNVVWDFCSSIPLVGPFAAFLILVWPLLFTVVHYYFSVYGAAMSMYKMQCAVQSASSVAQQGVSVVRDTAGPLFQAAVASAPGGPLFQAAVAASAPAFQSLVMPALEPETVDLSTVSAAAAPAPNVPRSPVMRVKSFRFAPAQDKPVVYTQEPPRQLRSALRKKPPVSLSRLPSERPEGF